jgi:hypothetical protein
MGVQGVFYFLSEFSSLLSPCQVTSSFGHHDLKELLFTHSSSELKLNFHFHVAYI